jgi:selenocysteine lyase/cysteine desulfurase
VVPYERIETAARRRGIALRGGCFCNPGAAGHAFDIPADRARTCLRGGFSAARLRACLNGAAVGALRASVGIATTTGDLDALVRFLDEAAE